MNDSPKLRRKRTATAVDQRCPAGPYSLQPEDAAGQGLIFWASDEDREQRMTTAHDRVRRSRIAQGLPEQLPDEALERLARIAFGR